MISAAKTTKQARGFTLIEIVVVLAISALIIAGAVGLMVSSSDERVLKNATGEIELLAKRARTTAILKQTPYALEFRQGIVRLMPFAQAGEPDKKSVSTRRLSDAPIASSADETRQITLESGLALSIRRWNSEKWLPTEKSAVHVWRFDPDGLSEPVSIRLTLGKSSQQESYHPLTATAIAAESQLEIR